MCVQVERLVNAIGSLKKEVGLPNGIKDLAAQEVLTEDSYMRMVDTVRALVCACVCVYMCIAVGSARMMGVSAVPTPRRVCAQLRPLPSRTCTPLCRRTCLYQKDTYTGPHAPSPSPSPFTHIHDSNNRALGEERMV